MYIKEKLEKAKEKVKRRVRKAAVGAALVGTLGAGAVSCGEANIKDNESDKTTQVKNGANSEVDTLYCHNTKIPLNDLEAGDAFDGNIDNATLHGLPLKKQAKNPNDPDSLLVQVTSEYKRSESGEETIVKKEAKYVAIDPQDKNKEIEFEYDGEKVEIGGITNEIVGYKNYHGVIYGPEGREEIDSQEPIVESKLRMKRTGTVSYKVKDKKVKSDTSKTETSAKTEARETPAWMGEPVSPTWVRPHGDSENKSESSKKANKKILDKIAKQKRER